MLNISNKRFKPQPRFIWFCAVLVAFLAYLALFLLQPSVCGLEDQDGNVLNRLTDILVMPGQVRGIFGTGAEPLSLLDRVPLLLGTAIWLGVCGWIGWPFVLAAFGDRLTMQTAVLAMLTGLATVSTATFLVGWSGGLGSRWPLVITLVTLAVTAGLVIGRLSPRVSTKQKGKTLTGQVHRKSRRRGKPSVAGREGENPAKSNASALASAQPLVVDALAPESVFGVWISRLIPLVTVLLVACYVLGNLLPAWEFDVLEYHLQAPKEFLENGKITHLDHNIYANMPLGAEMHSLAAMVLIGGDRGWWWGGLLGKSITGSYSLLAAALIGNFLALRFGRGCGWSSAGLLLATSGNAHVAMAGLIDSVIGAYVAGGLIVFVNVWPKLIAGQGRASEILLLGLMAGGGAACKYPGFVLLVVPLVVTLTLAVLYHRNVQQFCIHLITLCLALAVTCLPWLVKNAVETGNPIYPLAYQYLGGGDLSEQAVENWQRVHSPQSIGGTPAYSLTAAWQSIEQLTFVSPFLNPSLVFLTLTGLAFCICFRLRWHQPWLPAVVLLSAWSLSSWWLATHRIDRFWLPILPLAAIIAGVAAADVGRLLSTALANGMVLFGLCFGLLQVLSGSTPNDRRLFVSLASIEMESIGTDTTGAITSTAWINSHVGEDQKVLLIGDAQAYLYRVPIIYATCFNATPGEAWLADQPPETQRKNLNEAGVTHLVVDWTEIERYRNSNNYGFSEWPTHADIDQLVIDGVLKRVDEPFDPVYIEMLTAE